MVKTELKDWHPNILNSELTGKPMKNELLHTTIAKIAGEGNTDKANKFLEEARRALSPIISTNTYQKIARLRCMVTELEEILPPKMNKVPVDILQIRIVWMKIRKEYHEIHKVRKTHSSPEAIAYLAKKYHYSEKRITEIIYPQTKKDQTQSPE